MTYANDEQRIQEMLDNRRPLPDETGYHLGTYRAVDQRDCDIYERARAQECVEKWLMIASLIIIPLFFAILLAHIIAWAVDQ